MKITAQDLLRFGIIDTIVPEPAGGAHRDPEAAIAATGDAIEEALHGFDGWSRDADPGGPGRQVPGHRARR